MILEKAIEFYNKIKPLIPYKTKLVGSARRKKPVVTDIDVLIVSSKPIDLSKLITTLNGRILENGPMRKKLKFGPVKVDFFITTRINLPFALLHHTGSKDFNIRIRAHAKRNGYKLNQYGLFKGDKRVNLTTEKAILSHIGVTYKSPTQREN